MLFYVPSLPNRPKHTNTHKVPFPYSSIEDLCANSQHIIFESDDKSLACTRCKAFKSRTNIGLKHWLRGTCFAIGAAIDRPIPLQVEFIHIGNLNIHHSHKTYKFIDIFFCYNCGCFARSQIKHLSHPCQAPTESGLRFLAIIIKGIVPTGYLYSRLPNAEVVALTSVQDSVDALAIDLVASDSDAISLSGSYHSYHSSPFSLTAESD